MLRVSTHASSAPSRTIGYVSVTDLSAADLEGKRVFVRADLNTPLSKSGERTITDDTRIVRSLPTLEYLVANGAQVVLTSHLGRPKDGPEEKFNLQPVATRLRELGQDVRYVSDCIGVEAEAAIRGLQNGQVVLLENTRFYKEETKNDPDFARKLAHSADVYVNDAFGACHRAHASTAGVTQFIPKKVAGSLMKQELDYLIGAAMENPVAPFAAIVGGAKVSTKITVLRTLMDKCDKIFVGGGMSFTFTKAQGGKIGGSLCEEEQMGLALELLDEAKAKGVQLVLPVDSMCGDKFASDAQTKVVAEGLIEEGWMGLDIGPASIALFKEQLADCKTILWNGPLGAFEFEAFEAGTREVAEYLADLTDAGAITIVGGGDSVAAVQKFGLGYPHQRMSHISTGGGASLELLEGKVLPGVACLDMK